MLMRPMLTLLLGGADVGVFIPPAGTGLRLEASCMQLVNQPRACFDDTCWCRLAADMVLCSDCFLDDELQLLLGSSAWFGSNEWFGSGFRPVNVRQCTFALLQQQPSGMLTDSACTPFSPTITNGVATRLSFSSSSGKSCSGPTSINATDCMAHRVCWARTLANVSLTRSLEIVSCTLCFDHQTTSELFHRLAGATGLCSDYPRITREKASRTRGNCSPHRWHTQASQPSSDAPVTSLVIQSVKTELPQALWYEVLRDSHNMLLPSSLKLSLHVISHTRTHAHLPPCTPPQWSNRKRRTTAADAVLQGCLLRAITNTHVSAAACTGSFRNAAAAL